MKFQVAAVIELVEMTVGSTGSPTEAIEMTVGSTGSPTEAIEVAAATVISTGSTSSVTSPTSPTPARRSRYAIYFGYAQHRHRVSTSLNFDVAMTLRRAWIFFLFSTIKKRGTYILSDIQVTTPTSSNKLFHAATGVR